MHYMVRCLIGAAGSLCGVCVFLSVITPEAIFVGGVLFFCGLLVIVSAVPKNAGVKD